MMDNLIESGNGVAPEDVDQPTPAEIEKLRSEVIAALKTVFDPEIPVDIYELGLIYKLEVSSDRSVSIDMTLTSPACPVAGSLPGDVEAKVRAVDGIGGVRVELVWDPPWDMEKMSESAKLELGFL
jgi:FeS assembly SUF system protein